MTPHPALFAELNLKPADAWSIFFVDEAGEPAFSNDPNYCDGVTIIRRDLINKFAANRGLRIVWRIWVEKDGGQGTKNIGSFNPKFARHDFVGFYFQENEKWNGQLMPFRS